MDVASEMGILGLMVLLLIFWQILKTSWQVFRNSEDKLYKFFAGVFVVYFIWVLGYSLFDVVLLNDKVLMIFVVAVGILYSINMLDTECLTRRHSVSNIKKIKQTAQKYKF